MYEAQIIKCIEGKSKLSEATLARMISRAEDSVAVYEKEIEKARMDKQNQKDTAAQIGCAGTPESHTEPVVQPH